MAPVRRPSRSPPRWRQSSWARCSARSASRTRASPERAPAPGDGLAAGAFGARLSYVPTIANIVQCIGWGVFELVTIATAAHRLAPGLSRPGYVMIGGVLTAALTIRPLGAIRVLRRYATALVLVVVTYLLIEMLRHPLPAFGHGTWSGFWVATDTVVGAAISFAPLAADYTRHSKSGRATVLGALVGYGVSQTLCYVIGLLTLLTVARTPNDIYGAFIAVPLGAACFAVLSARELDQSFANVYSTAVSIQNLRPLWDRRVLALAISACATAMALWLNINDYENFLILLGSIFVPLFGVVVADYFGVSRGRWDLSPSSRSRFGMLGAWAAGFIAYQLINPGYLSGWVSAWQAIDRAIGFRVESWMSASICSFVVSAALTLAGGALVHLMRHLNRRAERALS